MTPSPSLAAQLDAADEYRTRLVAVLTGHYGSDYRSKLVSAYTSLRLEHHQAIVMLMRNGLNGSASALMRLLFEAVLRQHWIACCASEEQVEKVATTDDRFPLATSQLVEDVDRACTSTGLFARIKQQSWKDMNSYTHGGLHQIGRRFDGDELRPSYTEDEMAEVASTATSFIFMLGILRTGYGRVDAQEKVYALLDRFSEDPRISVAQPG